MQIAVDDWIVHKVSARGQRLHQELMHDPDVD
jgi:hypothetical protein